MLPDRSVMGVCCSSLATVHEVNTVAPAAQHERSMRAAATKNVGETGARALQHEHSSGAAVKESDFNGGGSGGGGGGGGGSGSGSGGSSRVESRSLVVWDIENVRALSPRHPPGVTLIDSYRHVRRELIGKAGYEEQTTRAICCVTPVSLKAMLKLNPNWVDILVPEVSVFLASYSRPKCSADFVLRREMTTFTSNVVAQGKGVRARIVLMTGDEDFLEPAQQALKQGIDVQLVYWEGMISGALLNLPYLTPPVEWGAFLRGAPTALTEANWGRGEWAWRSPLDNLDSRWIPGEWAFSDMMLL